MHAWDPVNHRLFSGGQDGQIHQWNVSTQTRLPSLVPPVNLSAPVTSLLVDPAHRRIFSSSTVVHRHSSNVTLPYPNPSMLSGPLGALHRFSSTQFPVQTNGVLLLQAPHHRPRPSPPRHSIRVRRCFPSPTHLLHRQLTHPRGAALPVGGYSCGKRSTCDDSGGENALNISEVTVQVLSDRTLAINVTCSPWHNRTFSTRNGERFDNPHCYHIDDHRCVRASLCVFVTLCRLPVSSSFNRLRRPFADPRQMHRSPG